MSVSAAFEPDVSKWDARRPEEAARLFAQVEAPWYVAAGWAIDLCLGGSFQYTGVQTSSHAVQAILSHRGMREVAWPLTPLGAITSVTCRCIPVYVTCDYELQSPPFLP